MTKRTRLIILLACAALFFIITPWLVAYSLGYRVNLENLTVTATGGIYVRPFPQGSTVTIDNENPQTTGILNPSTFTQNLLPGPHTVAIAKDGYVSYQKTLEIAKNTVAKVEHAVLFKKDIPFSPVLADADAVFFNPNGSQALAASYSKAGIHLQFLNLTSNAVQISDIAASQKITKATWSNDGTGILLALQDKYAVVSLSGAAPVITQPSYLLAARDAAFNPQNTSQIFFLKNKNIYLGPAQTLAAKNAAAFLPDQGTVTWLSYDGFLYRSNVPGIATRISQQPLSMNTASSYRLISSNSSILLQQDASLLWLDPITGAFSTIYSPVSQIENLPGTARQLLCNDREILLLDPGSSPEPVFLNRFSQPVSNCHWLGGDYVTFVLGGSVTISETDMRGNLNVITLPSQASLPGGKSIDISNPTLFFSQQQKQLYIFTARQLITSEKLIP
jgi:hypothetical protein